MTRKLSNNTGMTRKLSNNTGMTRKLSYYAQIRPTDNQSHSRILL